MAISHICHQCGWDLARVRAVPEPVYRLPLVSCPRCGSQTVRRRHPLIQNHRTGCRTGWSFIVFMVQFIIAASLLAMTVTFMVGCSLSWQLGPPTSRVEAFWIQMAVSGGLLSLVTGLWLSIGLSHVGMARAWTGWFMAVIVTFAITAVTIGVAGGMAELTDSYFDINHAWSWLLPALAFFLPPGIAAAVMLSVASLVALPVGRLTLRVHAISRRALWRWRRRRRRIRFAS